VTDFIASIATRTPSFLDEFIAQQCRIEFLRPTTGLLKQARAAGISDLDETIAILRGQKTIAEVVAGGAS